MTQDDRQAADELNLERMQTAINALLECKRKGVAADTLLILAAEIGVSSEWKHYLADTH